MANVVHFKQSDRVFEAYGDDPRRATISRLVGPELSKGTELAYEGDGATVFYALDPVDWKTRAINSLATSDGDRKASTP